ncbi:hypothetical protein ANO14919_006710 [Xylariales sp. No.14919]|nr:hypothetical protein ANO14919_006710 [Xylariales sp. No.14919]
MGDERSASYARSRFARYAGQRWAELGQCDVVTVGQKLHVTAMLRRRQTRECQAQYTNRSKFPRTGRSVRASVDVVINVGQADEGREGRADVDVDADAVEDEDGQTGWKSQRRSMAEGYPPHTISRLQYRLH